MKRRVAAAVAGRARIRRARAGDLPGILALEQLFPGDRMSARAARRFLRVPSARVWVAELPADGSRAAQMVGVIVLLLRRNSQWGRIYSVVVAPQARGQGLGARLVACAEREARATDCIGVSLEVRTDNVAAHALYAALGYQLQQQLPAYYEDGAPGVRLRRHFVGF